MNVADSDHKPASRAEGYESVRVSPKLSSNGITLVPQPSDDVQDPLNWSSLKKCTNFFIWCIGSFVTTASGLGNVLGYFVQAKVYHKSDPISLSYSVAPALGAGTIVDMFFLHQRGKAFTALNLSFLAGLVVGPTLSGFIVNSTSWTVQFWWSNGLEGIIIILSLALLEDTYYDRELKTERHRKMLPVTFFANRMATFFGGSHRVHRSSAAETVQTFCNCFLIGICPVTILCGVLTLIETGFAAFFNILLTVYLQNPIVMGGYGFTPSQNAEFLFSLWFGVIVAELYGHFANDRIPLWICRRNGGIWQPEYRLHTLWLPGLVILPIALGLYGASLQYHLHYMVLALATFLGGFATNAIVPVTTNYVVECFQGHASESAAIIGVYRLSFALTLPFFVPAWMGKVGAGWCLGMAAFFSIFAFGGPALLIWKGEVIRRWTFKRLSSNEEELRLIGKGRDAEELREI